MDATAYLIKNKYHEKCVTSTFAELYDNKFYWDAIVQVKNESFRCHRIVLSSQSEYFRSIFEENPSSNCVTVQLDYYKPKIIELILNYMYLGEVQVPDEYLSTFLSVAKDLGVENLKSKVEAPQPEVTAQSQLAAMLARVEQYSRLQSSLYPTYATPLNLAASPEYHRPPFRRDSTASPVPINNNTPSPRDYDSLEDSPLTPKHENVVANNYWSNDSQKKTPKRKNSPSGPIKSEKAASDKAPEKKYKQYTSEDMARAIEAVQRGLSAARAAKQYRVPSRTLYDKVSKLKTGEIITKHDRRSLTTTTTSTTSMNDNSSLDHSNSPLYPYSEPNGNELPYSTTPNPTKPIATAAMDLLQYRERMMRFNNDRQSSLTSPTMPLDALAIAGRTSPTMSDERSSSTTGITANVPIVNNSTLATTTTIVNSNIDTSSVGAVDDRAVDYRTTVISDSFVMDLSKPSSRKDRETLEIKREDDYNYERDVKREMDANVMDEDETALHIDERRIGGGIACA